MIQIIFVISNYLIGSISPSILISKYLLKKDIRKIGHKTAGGSNAIKTMGIKYGIIVGIFDILKPIPLLLLAKELDFSIFSISNIAIASILGHCWPIWHKFSGGRGIASFIGSIFIINFLISLPSIFVFIFILFSKQLKSLLNNKFNKRLFILSPAVITIIAIFVYNLSVIFIDLNLFYFAIISTIIIFVRRITARIQEYKASKSKLKLFFSRLIFDNSYTIS